MYKFLRKILFLINPETIHHLIIILLKAVRYIPFSKPVMKACFSYSVPEWQREVLGLTFTNPIGLAAGFDKNAEVVDELACLGFGFIEIGSVTPAAQPGNPKPRIFRLEKDGALINRMGINNKGAKQVTANLRKSKHRVIVGGNISKNSVTPNAQAVADYEKAFVAMYDTVDYFAINVSCPNVKDLTCLQDTESLRAIVEGITEQRKYHDTYKPVLLKLSPDLPAAKVEEVLGLVFEYGLDGLIVANTTTKREGLQTLTDEIECIGAGGLSGAPIFQNTLNMVRYIATLTKKQIPIIGVGGVMTADNAIELLEAGASLVQVYTGFIYNGPRFVRQILKKLKSSTTLSDRHTNP